MADRCNHLRIDDYRDAPKPDGDGVYHDSVHCAGCGKWLTRLTRERPSHQRMTFLREPTPSLAGTAETILCPVCGHWDEQHHQGCLAEGCACTLTLANVYYAALAERTEKLEETEMALRGFEKLAANRWDELTALRASLATAQEDTRRLDWLEGTGESYCNRDRVDRWGSEWISFDSEAAVEANDPTGRHAGIRAAIDAARPHATPEGE